MARNISFNMSGSHIQSAASGSGNSFQAPVNIVNIGMLVINTDDPEKLFEDLQSLPFSSTVKSSGYEGNAKEKDSESTLQQQRNQDSRSVVDSSVLQVLSSEVSREWKDLGRYLGISEARLNHIEEDNLHQREIIYQMLLCWKQINGSNATYGNLDRALKNIHRMDLAEGLRMKEASE